MKFPFKVTPIRLVLATVVLYAAGSALNLRGPSEAELQAETDRCLLDAMSNDPKDPLAHYLRALLHLKTGDLKVATAELNAAKIIDPTMNFAGNDGVGKGVVVMVERDIAAAAAPLLNKASPVFALVAGGIGVNALFVAGLIWWRRRVKSQASALVAAS